MLIQTQRCVSNQEKADYMASCKPLKHIERGTSISRQGVGFWIPEKKWPAELVGQTQSRRPQHQAGRMLMGRFDPR